MKVEVVKEGTRLNGLDVPIGAEVEIDEQLYKIWISLQIAKDVEVKEPVKVTETVGVQIEPTTDNPAASNAGNSRRGKKPSSN